MPIPQPCQRVREHDAKRNYQTCRSANRKVADRPASSREDSRSQTLALTVQGTKLVPELAALADQDDAEFFHDLPATERQSLERILRRMVEEFKMTAPPTE